MTSLVTATPRKRGRASADEHGYLCGWKANVIGGWLRARASERRGIGGHGAAGAPLDTLEMLLPSLPNFPLSVFPLILAPSRLSLSAAAPFDCLSFPLSLFSLRSLYSLARSPARSRSAKVDPLEQLDPGKRATDTAGSNRCCLEANETPQNPCLSRCETGMDLLSPEEAIDFMLLIHF